MFFFVVRDRKNAFFSAVAGDMKLEQSINRFSKGPGGHVVVGSSGDAAAVAEFELLFHEILSITNLVNAIMTDGVADHLETNIQHGLQGKKGLIFDRNVTRFLDIVNARGNPYIISSVQLPLHNFLTKHTVDEKSKIRILSVLQNGQVGYEVFRNERYIEKSKKISATISKVKLPSFSPHDTVQNTTRGTIHEVSHKELASSQRKIEVATLRGMPLEEIYGHDFFESSPLFEGDLATKPSKSHLIAEIENNLPPNASDCFKPDSTLNTHVLIDFMSNARQYLGFPRCNNFGHAIRGILNPAQRVAESNAVHIIFDSYKELSIKDSERIRRVGDKDEIELAIITDSVPIPKQMEKFWSSGANKEKLQIVARDVAIAEIQNLVLSAMVVDDEIVPAVLKNTEELSDIEELNSWEEEADCRIVAHANWAIKMGCKRISLMTQTV